MSVAAEKGRTRAERERLSFAGYFQFTAEQPALYRIIRQSEFVSPDAMHRHYAKIAEGYLAGLRQAMDTGEVVRADPEVLAWALIGVGELIGMRWILWDGAETKPVPDDVFEEMYTFITRGLGTPTHDPTEDAPA